MSYDLALWRGPQPAGPEEALARLEELTEAADGLAPPSPALRPFLDELAVLLPDDHPAWASSPVEDGVEGELLVLTLTYGEGVERLADVVDLAHRHGLVCLDLSAEALYPPLGDGARYADHAAGPAGDGAPHDADDDAADGDQGGGDDGGGPVRLVVEAPDGRRVEGTADDLADLLERLGGPADAPAGPRGR